jgi:hypothetical protein
MKKVDEGVALFDEIWEKVYTAEQQNQKEKYEMDLKKEIKKLQRLRDQIKTWIGSSDIKDKDNLLEARRLIETKMEQFKICEKETKTKTYSKEGLARAEKLDPAEIAKQQTTEWIGEYIERLNQLLEDREVEIERLSAGKGKKTNKHILEEYLQYVSMHKFHINKLEGIMRLVNNDVLDTDDVDNIRDDLDYYMESYEDDDYLQAYDEEYFYDSLGLDELDVVNVDRVTVLPTDEKKKKKSDDDSTKSGSKASSGKRKSKATAASSVIPLTIGRARVSSAGEKEKEVKTTPAKATRSATTGSVPAAPTPAARAPPPPAVATGGASMAAILKRESEQQEKERQQKAQVRLLYIVLTISLVVLVLTPTLKNVIRIVASGTTSSATGRTAASPTVATSTTKGSTTSSTRGSKTTASRTRSCSQATTVAATTTASRTTSTKTSCRTTRSGCTTAKATTGATASSTTTTTSRTKGCCSTTVATVSSIYRFSRVRST